MTNLKFHTKTVKGPRENNQDSLCAFMPDEDTYFFAIADGMGGGRSGNVASRLVIDKAKSYLLEHLPKSRDFSILRKVLNDIFMEAQIELQRNIENDKDLNGMGTTLTCLLFYQNVYIWGNVGDSRIYRLYDNKIEQITKDHSYLSDINVDPESQQSIASSYGHILTKAIDGGIDEPDIYPLDKEYETLDQPVSFLLCSDGLISDKSDADSKEFYNIYQESGSLDSVCFNLIKLAYDKGSTDNTSVILVDYKGGITRTVHADSDSTSDSKDPKRFGFRPIALAAVTFIVVFLISYGIYDYFTGSQQVGIIDTLLTPTYSSQDSLTEPNDEIDSMLEISSQVMEESESIASHSIQLSSSTHRQNRLSESELKWNASDTNWVLEYNDGISWFEYDTKGKFFSVPKYDIAKPGDSSIVMNDILLKVEGYDISLVNDEYSIDTTLSSKTANLSQKETEFLEDGSYQIHIMALLNNGDTARSKPTQLLKSKKDTSKTSLINNGEF